MRMKFEKLIGSPIGQLTLKSDGISINAIRFGDQSSGEPSCEVLEQAAQQLQEYFDGSRRSFSLPLQAAGTAFQHRVWDALRAIPYGETASYSDIAGKIGNPKACRAVGSANNRNPLPILVPCHRVIGKDGAMVGYAGGLEIKTFLLELEKSAKNNEI